MSSSAASFFPTKMGTTISDFTIGDPARYRGSAAAFEVRRTKDARSAGREHSRELLKRLQFICPVNTAGSIDRGHARSKSNRRSHTAGWTRGAEFEPAPINKTQVMILTNAEMSERLFYYGPSGRQRPNRPKPAPAVPGSGTPTGGSGLGTVGDGVVPLLPPPPGSGKNETMAVGIEGGIEDSAG